MVGAALLAVLWTLATFGLIYVCRLVHAWRSHCPHCYALTEAHWLDRGYWWACRLVRGRIS